MADSLKISCALRKYNEGVNMKIIGRFLGSNKGTALMAGVLVIGLCTLIGFTEGPKVLGQIMGTGVMITVLFSICV